MKSLKESIYQEYERYIRDEMNDLEKINYLKSGRFSMVTKIFLNEKQKKMKYLVMLVALIFFGVLFFLIKSESNQENINNSNTVKKNKVLHKCNLSNEIIDRESQGSS